jgi:hypothetical protein
MGALSPKASPEPYRQHALDGAAVRRGRSPDLNTGAPGQDRRLDPDQRAQTQPSHRQQVAPSQQKDGAKIERILDLQFPVFGDAARRIGTIVGSVVSIR